MMPGGRVVTPQANFGGQRVVRAGRGSLERSLPGRDGLGRALIVGREFVSAPGDAAFLPLAGGLALAGEQGRRR